MEIKCPACQSGYRIPKEKLPADKEMIAFPCPNCAHPLTVELNKAKEIEDPNHLPGVETTLEIQTEDTNDTDNMTEGLSKSYDATEKPFDFVHEGDRTALICESDQGLNQKIRNALEKLGFYCSKAESIQVALKQMRYHIFDLVVLNEHFEGKEPQDSPIRIYLGRLPMTTRRQIFVVLLTQRFRTMDNMAAYHMSVNQVIHEKNIDEMEKVVQQGIVDNDAFYNVFRKAKDSLGEV